MELILNEALRSCCGRPSRECRCQGSAALNASTPAPPAWLSPEQYLAWRNAWQREMQRKLVVNANVDEQDILDLPAIDWSKPSCLSRRVLPQPTINRSDANIGGFCAEWASATEWTPPTLNAAPPVSPYVEEDPLPLPPPLVTNEEREEMQRLLRRQ